MKGDKKDTLDLVKKSPPGVGGWLMWLILGLMVLGPLAGAGRIYKDIAGAEQQYPNLKSLTDWRTFKSAMWCAFLVFAGIGFYGGWGLAKGRDWLVVRRAKAILWIAGPGFLIVQGIIIPIMIFGKTVADDPKFIGGFLASIIATSIWTAYLSKSKRVRNTYGGSKNARESTET